MIGSIAAVGALERSKLRRERTERRALMLELVDDVLRNERVVKKLLDKKEPVTALSLATLNLNRKITVLRDAMQWIIPDNAAMVRAFGYIGGMTTLAEYGGNPSSDQLRIIRLDLQGKLASLRTWARAAQRELKS